MVYFDTDVSGAATVSSIRLAPTAIGKAGLGTPGTIPTGPAVGSTLPLPLYTLTVTETRLS
ncbi:hypothetical protein AWM70_05925 [Paenibacillus yonginensis]|uniref:Uncharacterized protein n=1 Tax=Paenibacillus yonginensis TaxID=1462996 RepID=A0A1B1MYD7_9BACL|nr:hypothetical protein AWM70_05925 [Paenibacillus yonginensis]